MKDLLRIIRRNFFSPIVIAIMTLALILLVLNEHRDAWFLSGVIVVNTLIAVVQEIRANLALKKLEIMSAPQAHILMPDGKVKDVMFSQLTVGDVIKLQMGDEVPADCKIIETTGLEVDESILTGESAPVDKSNESTIYAASIVVSGNAVAQVVAVGAATRVGSMTSTLKSYKPQLTPMQRDISYAITWLTYGALGLAVLIIIVYSLSGENAIKIFKTVASAAVTVVPEGLLLASSLLLAFGSLKLARAKVLPQKISAIEAMAQLNVLCVDKTGTLTSEDITFEELQVFDKSIDNIRDLIGIVSLETSSGSATNNAIINSFPVTKKYKNLQTMPFSSNRKMSGARIEIDNNHVSIVIGAPEILGQMTNITNAQKRKVESLASVGKRVLLVAVFDGAVSLKKIDQNKGEAAGIIILANELREGVQNTVSYLQKNGVTIKVISGDNPTTVRYIAKQAGIINHSHVMTGLELQSVSDKDWDEVVSKTTIFTRVLPEQKERLIDTFKKLGNYTGMVGDGVNDALALKKSDLGIAMHAGASASRRVADIVLLDNSFNSLPLGMRLGNRIMQAIEMIATLFFHKIIYGVILLMSTLAMGLVYPFEPRHITFMNIFLVTLPTIMWTVFTPAPRRRLSPRLFWRNTLFAVAPIAILSGLMIAAVYALLHALHPTDQMGVSTTTVIVATFFGIYLVFLVPRMFDVRNNKRAKLTRLLYVLATIIVIVPSFGVGFIRDFFNFSAPAWRSAWPLMIMILGVATLQWRIASNAGRRLKGSESKNN